MRSSRAQLPETIAQASDRLRSKGRKESTRQILRGRPDIAASMNLRSLFHIYARVDGVNLWLEHAGRYLLDEIQVELAKWRKAVRAQNAPKNVAK